jgi:PRTRC genetic system protein E
MFVELMPLLAGRTVLITVAKVDDKTLRVNVIPHGKADDNPALSTPLTYTGPPEELDAELGKHLAGYVQTHQQTANTLAEAKATMEAAAKAAQEEAKRKKATVKPPTTTAPASTPPTASPTPGDPVPSSAPMETLGLFPPATSQSQGGLAL